MHPQQQQTMPDLSGSSGTRTLDDSSPNCSLSFYYNNSSSAATADRFSFGSDQDNYLSFVANFPDPDLSTLQTEHQQQREQQWRIKKSRSEAKKSRSIDASTVSPRFLLGSLTAMKKSSAASPNFPSPGTPTYRPHHPKGWSSERVPPPAASSRRYTALPYNGRALPSKWEDAEKWIFSPATIDNGGRHSLPQPNYRRPKSKSGPLGPPACLSSAASPLNPRFDSGRVALTGVNARSPFLTGVLITDRGSCGSGGVSAGRSSSANADPSIVGSASIHGWSDTIESLCSRPSSRDEITDCTDHPLGPATDHSLGKLLPHQRANQTRAPPRADSSFLSAGFIISPTVLRKDVATQMSPEGSPRSSPKERPTFSLSPLSDHPIEEMESHFSKLEVRDVEVDDQVTVTRWSKKHGARGSDKHPMSIIEWKKKIVEAKAPSSLWEVAETAKRISKYKREEAKISAWENLQKAKAEAAIRKLEMKLEKKRSSSMDKILNKFRSAQRKAQEMRSAVTTNRCQQVTSSTKTSSYFRKTGQMGTLSGCFTCHAF